MTGKTLAAISSALATLLVAGLGAYAALRSDVLERPTETQVRQLVDDKTSDKFFEVFRRFDRMENKMDRIEVELTRQNRKGN